MRRGSTLKEFMTAQISLLDVFFLHVLDNAEYLRHAGIGLAACKTLV
jgi:hypothetical protein